MGAEIASSYRREQTHYQNAPLPPFIDELAEWILEEQPIAVGLSVCYSQQVWIAFCLARSLKQHANIPIVMGGRASREVPDYPLLACGRTAFAWLAAL